jgi:nicotinate-nucleotide adenylyltransferase
MKIGLFFGSFNPIHIGHLIIAEFVANNTDVNQVWLVVSPQNPLKPSGSLMKEYDRLHYVTKAVENNPSLRASDVEFKLPKPSYTIDTLTYLKEKYPQHEFVVIIGSDSFQNLPQWKNYELLVKDFQFIVYERPGFIPEIKNENAVVLKAPLLEISATVIRELIRQKKSVQYLIPDSILSEVIDNQYFKLV